MTTNRPPGPATRELFEALGDGAYHDGAETYFRIQQAIPESAALRKGTEKHRRPAPREELIASGRRHLAQRVIRDHVASGRVQLEGLDGLTREAWRGEVLWRLRDRLAGARPVAQAAHELGVEEYVLRNWIKNGHVTHTEVAGRDYLSPVDFGRAKSVRAVYEKGKRFLWDPRATWDAERLEALLGRIDVEYLLRARADLMKPPPDPEEGPTTEGE